MKINLIQKKIILVNQILIDYFGLPERPSKKSKPIDMLIATILSQNTNDKNSFQAYKNLKEKFPHWEEIAETSVTEIETTIKIAGLAKQKAKAIKNAITRILEKSPKASLDYLLVKSNDEIIDELTSFDGVGVKTASCVLLFSLDRNICPVDTHVHRTTNRIGIVKANTPDKTFLKLNEKFPDGIAHSFHTNLIRLGREVCLAQNPKCKICPVKRICKFPNKSKQKTEKSVEKKFMLLDNI